MKKRLVYFNLFIICFFTCIVIVKLFSNNQFIRGFIGDVIVVLLIYFFIKIFYDFNYLKLSIFVLVVAYATEFLQYFKLTAVWGLQHNSLAQLVLGAVFDPYDLIAYTIGAILVYTLDNKVIKKLF